MGIISRILRICQADAHGLLDRIEDKGRLLRQCMREMEVSLDQKARRLKTLERDRDRLSEAIRHSGKWIEQLKRDLHLAVEKDQNDIARALIRKRLFHEAETQRLMEQLASLDREISTLSKTLTEQRRQYASVKAKNGTDYQSKSDDLFQKKMAKTDFFASSPMPGEEEIEIELLRAKEKMFAGDNP